MSDLMAQSSSFSGDSGSHERFYDVFLSFRGEDTGKNFVDHVYAALEKEGFLIFRDDDETKRGEDIKSELPKIICKSRCSIVVISEGYASSGRCLDELVVILECKRQFRQIFLPAFYGVDPSHVRKRTGWVAKAFARHAESQSLGKVERWWAALKEAALAEAALWPDMVLQNEADRNVSESIKKLVAMTEGSIQQSRSDRTNPYLVGIDSRVKDINSWLQDENSDIDVFVIHGMIGIGKTTVARYAYTLNVARFGRSCFLENVSESSRTRGHLEELREFIAENIYYRNVELPNVVSTGTDAVRSVIKSERDLVVLDGLENTGQHDFLIDECALFGCKIIITTENASVGDLIFGREVCSVGILNYNESLELFCWHAFQQSHPIEGYMEHSNSIVKYCGGLPLALTILGSSLSGQNIVAWESTLKELETIPHPSIMEILERSYYSVNDRDRALFLCIACCYIGCNRDYIIVQLSGGDFNPTLGMESLIENCLLTIDSDNKVNMHPLVRDMGRRIVQRVPKERVECSGLLRKAYVFQALTAKDW